MTVLFFWSIVFEAVVNEAWQHRPGDTAAVFRLFGRDEMLTSTRLEDRRH